MNDLTTDKNESNKVPISYPNKEANIGNKKGKLKAIQQTSQSTNLMIEKMGLKFEVVKTLSAKGKNQFHVFLEGKQLSNQLPSMNQVNDFIKSHIRGVIYQKVIQMYIDETGKNPIVSGDITSFIKVTTDEFQQYWNLHKNDFGINFD